MRDVKTISYRYHDGHRYPFLYIPKSMFEESGLKPGDRVAIAAHHNIIAIVREDADISDAIAGVLKALGYAVKSMTRERIEACKAGECIIIRIERRPAGLAVIPA